MRAKLKAAIVAAGWKQIALAQHLGMPPNKLSAIVQGWRSPSDDERRAIAAAVRRSERGLFVKEAIDVGGERRTA